MPQFKPTYVNIPEEIKDDPEKFGLQKEYWPPDKPSLMEVESCNQIALQQNTTAALTDEQWESYWKAVEIIKRFEHELIFKRMIKSEKKREKMEIILTKNDVLKILCNHFSIGLNESIPEKPLAAGAQIYWEGNLKPEKEKK